MYTEKNKSDFFLATNSLKKYRRADILDEKGNTLIQDLYVDLLPNQQVFRSCLTDNTTFLVGRKGTGKSTIILRLENEYRKKRTISHVILIRKLFLKVQEVNLIKSNIFPIKYQLKL